MLQNQGRNDGKLIRAIYDGNPATVRSELAVGDVDLSLTFNGKSFLRHAGERGHPLIISSLLENGADPNERQGKTNYTLLHSAAASQNYGFARLLLEHGAEPSPRNVHNVTPLHFAARLNQGFMVQLLITKGADVEALDSNNRTPLFVAVMKGNSSAAKSLVRARANVRATDSRGRHAQQVAEDAGIDLRTESFSFLF